MGERKVLDIPLNRAEGDLEIRVEVEGGVVTDAWSAGTMYRGFENLLVGRGALDGLVVTPRICGICTTTHLTAAVLALDDAACVRVPDDAVRLRNVALATEHVQSDVRQAVLMYMADFAGAAHAGHSLHDEAVRRYAPLKGGVATDTIRETKRVLEIVAIIGGQWPHSSFMVPGGVTHRPEATEILRCRHILHRYREWYERRVLGCSIGRWREIRTAGDLDAWVEENGAQRNGEIGFFMRFCREACLDSIGRGCGRFLSFGGLDLPAATRTKGRRGKLVAAGLAHGGKVHAFDQAKIAEHIASSWFEGYEGGRHPFEGLTRPYASGDEAGRYSWAKAPRYDGHPAETGPLAELLVARDPLFTDLVTERGPSAMVRQLARMARPAILFDAMDQWLDELMRSEGDGFHTSPGAIRDGRGMGLTQAARGALGHWVTIAGGRIQRYQIITPTAWNASPRDSAGVRGPWEEALIGTPVRDPANPVEIGHVIRSFDPCLVCCVHSVKGGRSLGRAVLQV
ncbi:MAG: nickel-dependent hydrogenase large subunit [Magnetospirillum sp.]|nr:nickel-dependent hydrogenase large subunit [Magnetospirillum sp.]